MVLRIANASKSEKTSNANAVKKRDVKRGRISKKESSKFSTPLCQSIDVFKMKTERTKLQVGWFALGPGPICKYICSLTYVKLKLYSN